MLASFGGLYLFAVRGISWCSLHQCGNRRCLRGGRMGRLTRKGRWIWRGPRRAITLDVDLAVEGLLLLRWTLRGIKVWDVGALGWGSL
ncbi:hypothetical protein BDV38DRAFT_262706 [Aspergillus pseudotamarii]|uniref:Uncharacterized protein n=1 Tax=Aspergillus pseudotamarii TaxID=132259 RepID=A0A5N6SB85_ASPPS|nr:uncharacterized protein BDV38DRAFT_262706 [Aspergillus pseudotamarii]KAE8131976.1 hypothetical protein BDV38DRAFT_262706 [Aspergillus pseudotamarii]